MDFALADATDDLDLLGGDLFLKSGNDAVAQYVGQRIKTNLAEWFLDEQRGYPYFDLVFQKNPNYVAIDATLKDYIVKTQGIVELLTFDLTLNPAARSLTLSFTGRSKDGIIVFDDTVGV